jgi:hypothetical protein
MATTDNIVTEQDRRRIEFLREHVLLDESLVVLDDRALDAARAWSRDLLDRLSSVDPLSESTIRAIVEDIEARLERAWLRRGPSLREAAREVWAEADDGAYCPVCRKWVRRYWHRLNASMARGLAWLVLAARRDEVVDDDGWVHVPTHGPRWLVRTNQHATLRLWGLAERRAVEDGTSVKCSGRWRPTERGFAFVDGLVEVEDRVLTYNGEVVARGTETIRFERVLDVQFDYETLMATPGRIPVASFEHDEEGVR